MCDAKALKEHVFNKAPKDLLDEFDKISAKDQSEKGNLIEGLKGFLCFNWSKVREVRPPLARRFHDESDLVAGLRYGLSILSKFLSNTNFANKICKLKERGIRVIIEVMLNVSADSEEIAENQLTSEFIVDEKIDKLNKLDAQKTRNQIVNFLQQKGIHFGQKELNVEKRGNVESGVSSSKKQTKSESPKSIFYAPGGIWSSIGTSLLGSTYI